MLPYHLHLLFFFCFIAFVSSSSTNPVASSATTSNIPQHLTFNQYKSVLSFANNEGENQLSESVSDDQLYNDLILDFWNWNDADSAKKEQRSSEFNLDNLFPFIICHIDNSVIDGTERYDIIESVLAKEFDDDKNNSRYFVERTPIYNRNIKLEKHNEKNENEKKTLSGSCFYATLKLELAKNIRKEEILVTPVAPLLKMREDFSRLLDNNEYDIDENTISMAVMLAPGIVPTKDAVLQLANKFKKMQNLDKNSPLFSDCDKRVFRRSTVSVGSSNISHYFFYEFQKQDLVAGITHRCHRILAEYIAAQQQVISVEKVAKNTISNFHAKWIVESSLKEKNPLGDIGLSGNGEVIFVADTGLDVQHCYLKDSSGETVPLTTDFDLTGKINHDLRKVIQYIALDGIDSDSQDQNGHGTHVVGTIVGKRLNGSGQETPGVGEGIASSAKVAFYDGNSGESKSVSVNSIISQFFYFATMAGARIHSASWNSGFFGRYEETSRQVDEYFYNDPDDNMLMITSSGNDGLGETGTASFGTVKYPCVSKNALCIGASHNYESNMNDIHVVAFFSSYGPTADGRIKPDLIAPGYRILSLEANSNKCGASQYNSVDGLTFKSGTSMACPVVAGAGALVREYFATGYYPTGEEGNEMMDITGSLLKAVLINGAVELKFRSKDEDDSGDRYIESSFYDRYQGYGIVNLVNSLKLAGNEDSPSLYVENKKIVEKGQTHEYKFPNVCDDREFRVTIVWRDPPGASGCNHCLVNDLDMLVEYDDNTYYPNGKSKKDDKNNVERVILEKSTFINSSNNIVKVKVKAADLGNGNSQQYSLSATGCFDSTEVIFNGPEQSTTCIDDEFEYIVDIFTNRKPEETSWVLEYQGSKGNISAKRTGQYDEMLHLYRETGCMKYGCSLFLIKDNELDGLCCEKGMGSYTIKVGNEIKIKGESFNDRQDIEQFCHYKEDEEEEESTPSPTALVCDADEFKYQVDIETDLFPDEIRWELTKPQIDGVKHGFYSRYNFDHIHAGCLDIGDCYAITGAQGKYEVKVEGMILADGFFEEKVQTFCYLSDTLQPSLKPSFQPSLSSQPTSSPSMQPSTEPTITTSPSMFICSEKESFSFFNIVVKTDNWPQETSWVLTDEDGTLIGSVEPGDYVLNSEKYEHPYCLISSKCYSFQIKDTFGDGIKNYPSRYYEVLVNGVVMAEGGDFEYEETTQICYHGETNSPTLTLSSEPSSSPIVCNENEFRYDLIMQLDWAYDTSWELNYRDSGEVIDTVEYSIDDRNEKKLYSYCLPMSCFRFTIKNEFMGFDFYELSVGDYILIEGGELETGEEETKEFCYNGETHSPTSLPSSSPSMQPSTFPSSLICNESESKYDIYIQTDIHPQDTSWVLEYDDGTEIDRVEEGTYTAKLTDHFHTYCLSQRICLKFTIKHPHGFGFFGINYAIMANGAVVAKTKAAYEEATQEFCYYTTQPAEFSCGEGQSRYHAKITTEFRGNPEKTWWELYPTSITEGVPFMTYRTQFQHYSHSGCLRLGCYDLRIYDGSYDGLCCYFGSGSYKLSVDDNLLLQGRQFEDPNFVFTGVYVDPRPLAYIYERRNFCYNNPPIISPTESNFPSQTTDTCAEGQFEYRIIVRTEISPYQTYWNLSYSNGTEIEIVETNTYWLDNYEYTHRGCASLNECFVYFYDGWGGSYTLFANDMKMFEEEDHYGSGDTEEFCFSGSNSNSPSTSPPTMLFCDKEDYYVYDIVVKTDKRPLDTYWEFMYNNGTLIGDVKRYHYTETLTEYIHSYCLPVGCFRYVIHDEICCSWGDGQYMVKVGDYILTKGGEFSGSLWYETKEFCYYGGYETNPPTESPTKFSCDNENEFKYDLILTTDLYPGDTSWVLQYENGTEIDRVDQNQEYYAESFQKFVHSYCLPMGCYRYIINDYDGNGFCCDEGYEIKVGDYVLIEGGEFEDQETKEFCYHGETNSPSISLSPTTTGLVCGDNEFQYELVLYDVNVYGYFGPNTVDWSIGYKYKLPFRYHDERSADLYPNSKSKSFIGCLEYSCFKSRTFDGFFILKDANTGVTIAQNTDRYQYSRFCHYAPEPTTSPTKSMMPSSSTTQISATLTLITITYEFSTSSLDSGDVSTVTQKSVESILNHAISTKNELLLLSSSFDSVIVNVFRGSCEDFRCDISLQICEGSCDTAVEPDFMAFIANTMNDALASGTFLHTLKDTADALGIDAFDSLDGILPFDFDFDYEVWPTISPTKEPMTLTPSTSVPTECKPTFVQLTDNIKLFIASIFAFIFALVTAILSFLACTSTNSEAVVVGGDKVDVEEVENGVL